MPFDVFISFAREDREFCKALEKHLVPLSQQSLISLWKENDLSAGSEWQARIMEHLNHAHIILLLISADFMASDACYTQMEKALERQKTNKVCVIPIILRPVCWEDVAFSHLQVLPFDGEKVKPVSQWPQRDAAYVNIVRGIAAAIEEFKEQKKIRKAAKNAPHMAKLKGNGGKAASGRQFRIPAPIWRVPFKRDPYFTGREDILANLHDMLAHEHTTTITQPSAIHGLGGIGKTHLAVEYAYRYKSEYQYVLWLQADNYETLAADYVAHAHTLKCIEDDIQEQGRAIEAMKRWLESTDHWLLIFDNANTLRLLDAFLPENMRGHLLITTRASTTGGFARSLEIAKMETEEGAAFLLHRTGLLPLDLPLSAATESDRSTAIAIVQEMDALPLALDQAAAYIDETACLLTDYLETYKKHRAELLKKRGERLTHPASVTTTFDMAFKNVQQAHPAAADLLRLCAFLAPDAIPEELFTRPSPYDDVLYQPSTYAEIKSTTPSTWKTVIKKFFTTFRPETTARGNSTDETGTSPAQPELKTALETFVENSYEFDIALGELRKFSLIQRLTQEHTLFVHRLVQAVLQDELPEQTRQQWQTLAIQILAKNFPDPGYADIDQNAWNLRKRMFSHALLCASYIQSRPSLPATRLLNNIGTYFYDLTQYEEAERYLQWSITLSKKVLGVALPHPLGNLGKLYELQGKYKEAKKLYQQASKNLDSLLGSEYFQEMVITHNEAQLQQSQGNYREAEQLFKQTLKIRTELFGDDHPIIASTLGGLGAICYYQGRYQEAEEFFQKGRQLYEQIVGNEHPEFGVATGALAMNYERLGRYQEAERLFQQAQACLEKAYGKEHPRTAQNLHNMSILYYVLNRDDEGLDCIQQALAIREKLLGEEHNLTATSLLLVGAFYREQGKDAEVEEICKKSLAISQKGDGPKHYSASMMGNLADVYIKQNKYGEAEQLTLEAVAIQERELGVDHPEIASLFGTLALIYEHYGLHKKAEQYVRQALAIDEKALGTGHPTLARDLANVAAVYISQKRLEEAEHLLKRALIICEKPGVRKSQIENIRVNYNDVRMRRQQQMSNWKKH